MRIFTWEQLSSVRSASFLNVGYIGLVLVPIVAYIINQANDLPGINWQLPPSLFLLYLSSFLLSFSHFCNDAFCPPLIKRYSSFDNYTNNLALFVSNSLSLVDSAQGYISHKADSLVSHKFGDIPDEYKNALVEALTSVRSDIKKYRLLEDLISKDYKAEWDKQNNSKVSLRFFIVAFYIIASLIGILLIGKQFTNVLTSAI